MAVKAVLCVQFSGKSMQGGVLAACISVKVTVDFCCTVPFLINIAPIAHNPLSLYFCSHTHRCTLNHSSAVKDTNIILSISFLLCMFSFTVMSDSVSGPLLPSVTARRLQVASNNAMQLPKQLSLKDLYENQSAIIVYCSLELTQSVSPSYY